MKRVDAPVGTFVFAAAVEHLRRAIELSEQFRESAREDSDFDPIREEQGFEALVGR